MNEDEAGPTLFAWCDQVARVDAFAAALAALNTPDRDCSITIESLGSRESIWSGNVSVDAVVACLRTAFTERSYSHASFDGPLSAGCWLHGIFYCHGSEYEHRYPSGPLEISMGERKHVFPRSLTVALGPGERDLAVEAAMLSMYVQQDVENVLSRLCTPDGGTRVVTGAYSNAWFWGAPLEMCATYHADADAVARDLALSWIHLHDGVPIQHLAGLTMEALLVRIEAAPSGARAPVALTIERTIEHVMQERALGPAKHVRHGRAWLPGDVALSREAVLGALSAPPGTLLNALEACALPDDEWRAVEPRAREVIQATKDSAPTYEVNVTTRKHVQFIERHAPYHVRRLPNGGVMLATHPYRTLWQLYADALFLLGIAE